MTKINDLSLLESLFRRWGNVIHLSDADRAGIPRSVLRRQEARGYLLRLGKAAFIRRAEYLDASAWEQFRYRAQGYVLCSGTDAYLTGPAAALHHGIPVDGRPPALPTAVRPGNAHLAPLRSVHGRTRWGYLPPQHRTRRSRIGVVSPAYTLVDIARHGSPLAGLIAADHLLHSGLDPEVPARLVRNMPTYPGMARAAWVLEHADSRCESPLETAGRYVFIRAGRAVPLSNVWIYGASLPYRVDHLIPEFGIVLEGDGAVKYNNRPDAAEIVSEEKERHRAIERLGFSVIRYTDQTARQRSGQLLRDVDLAIAQRRGRPGPPCWGFEPPWQLGRRAG